jgi:RNA-directed DNA polymerase
VVSFARNQDRELLALRNELLGGAYQPSACRLFTVYERKLRLIAATPFRDRIVHRQTNDGFTLLCPSPFGS